jgi:D-alanine--D-alanine ligase
MQACIICNSDSDEKGISINSSKSIYEILEYYKFIKKKNIIFFNGELEFFLLGKEFIFSNTMEDFLHYYKSEDKIVDYINHLKSYDLIILTAHGKQGEDGVLEKILEDNNIKYIGPSYFTAMSTFGKLSTLQLMWEKNICNKWLSEIFTTEERLKNLLLKYKELCIKPNNGGSSIGVSIINNLEDGIKAINDLQERFYEPLIEEVHEGVEFSITIIGEEVYEPIEIVNNGIFTYEKKYFPTEKILYNYPAKFPEKIIKLIKEKAYEIYKLFKCEYFLRIDGFFLKNSEVIFTDLNSIPGFQLNGLFFKYKNHFEVMGKILNIFFQKNNRKKIPLMNNNQISINKKNVFLIFGGDSSEKNVSVISGTNILFNLYKTNLYHIHIFLLYKNKFYNLSYKEAFQNSMKDFMPIINNNNNNNMFSFEAFIELVKKNNGKVFMGLHGGIGEDGTLQKIFEENHVPYTGSNSIISKLSMSKYKTIEYIKNNVTDKKILKHLYFNKTKIIYDFKKISIEDMKTFWEKINPHHQLIFIKPNDDGCSVGAMILNNLEELIGYWEEVKKGSSNYKNHPLSLNSKDYLLCEYIEVDKIFIGKNNQINPHIKTGWIEGTVGFLNNKIFTPSVSLANNGLLTMEEKFLHGTGINLTPIPNIIMEEYNNLIIQKVIKHIIKKIKINTYCRVDFFYNVKNEVVNIIEINTLPALTSATVLFQQGAYSKITPVNLIKKILDF